MKRTSVEKKEFFQKLEKIETDLEEIKKILSEQQKKEVIEEIIKHTSFEFKSQVQKEKYIDHLIKLDLPRLKEIKFSRSLMEDLNRARIKY
jgi:phenylalanyl-tRNA synthetase beta subunit